MSETSRRAVLQSSGAAAAALALTPAFGEDPGGKATSKDVIKIGLIGCGGRGNGAATQALAADPGVQLWAVGDAFQEAMPRALAAFLRFGERAQVPAERQFAGLDAFQKVIESGVDVVLLATPPAFRPQHFAAAVAAKKHVFVEKPMAVDMEGVRSVLDSAAKAKAAGISVQHGFCWRFHPGTREAYQKVHAGELGKVLSVYGTYLATPVKPLGSQKKPDGMAAAEWQLRNWFNFEWLSAGPLVEQCIHTVDKVAWAMQDAEPVAVVANGGRIQKDDASDIYDHYNVAFEYDNGVVCHVGQRHFSDCYTEVLDRVVCQQGTMYAPGRCVIKDHDGKTKWRARAKKGTEQNMYQVCHNEFFAALRAGTQISTGEYMAKSTALGLFGREAAHTGQRLLWKDFWGAVQSADGKPQDLAPDLMALDGPVPAHAVPVPG